MEGPVFAAGGIIGFLVIGTVAAQIALVVIGVLIVAIVTVVGAFIYWVLSLIDPAEMKRLRKLQDASAQYLKETS